MLRASFAAVCMISSAAFAACGVTFGNAPEGNDFFTSLDVTGEMVTGAPLTAAVAYETFYPVPVDVTCELRQESDLIREIGRFQAPAVPESLRPEDEDERVPGNQSIDFVVEEAGEFKVECYTPLDEANFIIDTFDVAGAG